MEKKDYQLILSQISNITPLLKQQKETKKQLTKIRKRIKTIAEKYWFLNTIIDKEGDGKRLEYAIKKLLMDVGYDRVDWLNASKNRNKEDVRAWRENDVILIEVTGTKNKSMKTSHSERMIAFLHYADNYPSMKDHNRTGLVIVNHDNEKYFTAREKNPFTDTTTVYAASKNKVSLITTFELLYGFIELKRNEITLKEFHNILTKGGIIYFKKKREVLGA